MSARSDGLRKLADEIDVFEKAKRDFDRLLEGDGLKSAGLLVGFVGIALPNLVPVGDVLGRLLTSDLKQLMERALTAMTPRDPLADFERWLLGRTAVLARESSELAPGSLTRQEKVGEHKAYSECLGVVRRMLV